MKIMRNIIAIGLLAAAAAEAAAQDTLRFHDTGKTPMQGEITSLNYKIVEIEIELGGLRVPTKVTSKEVREIEIDPMRRSFDFSSGLDAMNQGNYAQAIERLERARKDSRDVVKQSAGINIVRCHFYGNDFKGALEAIKAFRQEKSETFYLQETYDIEFRCHMALGDANGASQAASGLEQRGRSDRLDDWVKMADVMRGQIHEAQGKWPEALAVYRRLARDRDVGEEASLGELRCLRQLKNWSELKAKADLIINSAKDKGRNDRTLTGAFNARGEAHLQGGNAKEALLDFMRGVAVLNKGGVTSREHEHAMAAAAVACARIAAAEKDKVKKDTYRGRAQELLADLDKIYPKSAFRGEAAKAIQEIK